MTGDTSCEGAGRDVGAALATTAGAGATTGSAAFGGGVGEGAGEIATGAPPSAPLGASIGAAAVVTGAAVAAFPATPFASAGVFNAASLLGKSLPGRSFLGGSTGGVVYFIAFRSDM